MQNNEFLKDPVYIYHEQFKYFDLKDAPQIKIVMAWKKNNTNPVVCSFIKLFSHYNNYCQETPKVV
jgi:hypothetical protein